MGRSPQGKERSPGGKARLHRAGDLWVSLAGSRAAGKPFCSGFRWFFMPSRGQGRLCNELKAAQLLLHLPRAWRKLPFRSCLGMVPPKELGHFAISHPIPFLPPEGKVHPPAVGRDGQGGSSHLHPNPTHVWPLPLSL